MPKKPPKIVKHHPNHIDYVPSGDFFIGHYPGTSGVPGMTKPGCTLQELHKDILYDLPDWRVRVFQCGAHASCEPYYGFWLPGRDKRYYGRGLQVLVLYHSVRREKRADREYARAVEANLAEWDKTAAEYARMLDVARRFLRQGV